MPDPPIIDKKIKMRIAMTTLLQLFNFTEITDKQAVMQIIDEMTRLLEGEVQNED